MKLNKSNPVFHMWFADAIVRAAAMIGIPVDNTLTSLGVDLDNDAYISLSEIVSITNALLEDSPYSTILPIMHVMTGGPIVEFISVVTTAKSVKEGIDSMMEYGPYHLMDLYSYYELLPDADYFVIEVSLQPKIDRRLMIEMAAGCCFRLIPAQFIDNMVLQVEFEFESQGNDAEYEQYFGCPVLFEQSRNRVKFKKGIAETQLNSHSPARFAKAIEVLKYRTIKVAAIQGFTFQVAQSIRILLENCGLGNLPVLSIDRVADHLSMSVRSLQRKLKQENASFTDVKYQTLINESKQYLDNGESNLDLIAEVLGFADRASFSKVFKKYESIWPAQYKRRA